ncbi:MAG TPA: PaaI family thioesterase [Trebonia sp.]
MDAALHDILTSPRGGPEALFDVGPLTVEPGQARASMPAGSWLRGRGGRLSTAGTGVLLDDVLGQAVLSRRPAGHWAVTTELNLDVAAPLPADGQMLDASASPVHVDEAGGLARAEVRDAAGRLLVLGTSWLRFIPGVPDAALNPPPLTDVADRGDCLTDLLRVRFDESGHLELPVRADLGNPRGVLHGGVLLCLAVMSAESVVDGGGVDTASVRITYLRPAIGDLTLTPAVVHRGRSLGLVRVDVRNAAGALCTTATVSSRSAVGPGGGGAS